MRDIEVSINDSGQRIDRFLKKYLGNANSSLIQKFLRTKKVKVNRKKVDSNYVLNEKDIINIFIYEEELKKLTISKERRFKFSKKLNIVYEDDNIIVMNKPKDLLSHASSKEDYGNNLVDFMIGYLIESGSYIPRSEKTFVPAIINRLDRNTSGLVIGAKNSNALRELNSLKENCVKKYYKTIVSGNVKENFVIRDKIFKDEKTNKSFVSDNGKESVTEVFVINKSEKFTLLEIKLVTGRTHQIRAHLSSKGFFIIGDIKYGDKNVNKVFREKFNLKNQFLHAEKIVFKDIQGDLGYLNDKVLIAPMSDEYVNIIENIF
ncbi:MAG: RluA family pseudouridine synthase [Peptoniphilaceae bacterium]|uniref:RluA family pseudouridine synthase n=1 Tax=Parvimonas sp. TaxID=1944660 RepID=UPI0025CBB649|nr:RluA family pseudouridine synthase [Parvimonas sp.]MCI5997894.1 RluA family pseudouridine synthase [Parvimonas sp.]MDD7764497.1 RluA family pseudouridine synthase [Peptoniphilaceae bacterium]MDY3050476.1 RluA family pseudouridine synthase [Parvimonas sp.]